jgi:hypothetical protein
MIVNNKLWRMWNERIMAHCEPIFPYLREGTEKIMRTSDHSLFVHFPFRASWYWVHFDGLICNNDMLCPSQYLNQASPYYETGGIIILNASNSLRESSRTIIIRAVLLWQDKKQRQKKAYNMRLKIKHMDEANLLKEQVDVCLDKHRVRKV